MQWRPRRRPRKRGSLNENKVWLRSVQKKREKEVLSRIAVPLELKEVKKDVEQLESDNQMI